MECKKGELMEVEIGMVRARVSGQNKSVGGRCVEGEVLVRESFFN